MCYINNRREVMRKLSAVEELGVAGGDVVVPGRRDRFIDPLGNYFVGRGAGEYGGGGGGSSFTDAGGGGGDGGEVLDEVVVEASKETHETDPAELLKFWENLIGSLSVAQQAALAAALLVAAKNAVLSPHSQALAALSGAVSGGNANMAADIHYAANSQGYGLKMDGAIKGVLDKVRSRR